MGPRTCFVFSIICRPYAVTLDEIARQGNFPMVAPVKPYTEFALIYDGVITLRYHDSSEPTLRASCRPSNTARLNGSVSFLRSALARFRAEIKSSNTVGNRPFLFSFVTNKSANRLSANGCPQCKGPTIVGCLDVIYIFDEIKPIDRLLVQKGGIAQVMRHHN